MILDPKGIAAADRAYRKKLAEMGGPIDTMSAAITAYLDAVPSAAAPATWRLVPVEPTDEMNLCGVEACKMFPAENGWRRVLESFSDSDCAEIYRAMLAAAPELPAGDGWQDIASAPSAKPVLVAYKNRCGKWRIVKAVRYEQYQNEQPADDDEGEVGEYCEEKYAYFVRAGWYELIDNWDDFGFVSIYEGEPVAWQPLPPAPKGRE